MPFRLWRQRRHPGTCDYTAQCPGLHVPRPTLRQCPCGHRRTAWTIVIRYSLDVELSHLLLRAGLSRRTPSSEFQQPSGRSVPTTPEGSSVPASGSLAPSLAWRWRPSRRPNMPSRRSLTQPALSSRPRVEQPTGRFAGSRSTSEANGAPEGVQSEQWPDALDPQGVQAEQVTIFRPPADTSAAFVSTGLVGTNGQIEPSIRTTSLPRHATCMACARTESE